MLDTCVEQERELILKYKQYTLPLLEEMIDLSRHYGKTLF